MFRRKEKIPQDMNATQCALFPSEKENIPYPFPLLWWLFHTTNAFLIPTRDSAYYVFALRLCMYVYICTYTCDRLERMRLGNSMLSSRFPRAARSSTSSTRKAAWFRCRVFSTRASTTRQTTASYLERYAADLLLHPSPPRVAVTMMQMARSDHRLLLLKRIERGQMMCVMAPATSIALHGTRAQCTAEERECHADARIALA